MLLRIEELPLEDNGSERTECMHLHGNRGKMNKLVPLHFRSRVLEESLNCQDV
jgi:hypothetical protein